MGWYDDLTEKQAALARLSPAGLAVVHTSPFPEESGQRWKCYPYFALIQQRFMPKLVKMAPPGEPAED